MSHRWTAAVLVALSVAGSASDLLACGDKFIVPTRGARFSKPRFSREDVGVLVYANDGTELFRMMNKLSLEATLLKAGYRATIVRTDPELTMALAQRSWDLVVVDTSDVTRGNPSRERSDAAVLRVSHARNAGAFVEMIDAAIERHRRARPEAE